MNIEAARVWIAALRSEYPNPIVLHKGKPVYVAHLNDELGLSFEEIADLIEQRLLREHNYSSDVNKNPALFARRR